MADTTETQPDRAPDGNSGSAAPQPGAGGPVQLPGVPGVPGLPVETAQVPAGPATRTSNKTLGLRAITAGAVVTAVISSIINPDFLGKAWHAVAGDSGGTTTTATVPLGTKSNGRLSIVANAPVSWGLGNPPHNIFGKITPGDTLSTGTDPRGTQSGAVARLFVAASHDGVQRLGVKPANPDAALVARLHRDHWTADDCRLVGESRLPNAAFSGPMREWTGCDGFADSTMWESWARTADSGVLVYVQLVIRRNDLAQTAGLEILRSIVVDPARLRG